MPRRIPIGVLGIFFVTAALFPATSSHAAVSQSIFGKKKNGQAVKEVPAQLPKPDGKPAEMTKPVKIFILLGQSNMLGFGIVEPESKEGTLSHLTRKQGKYPHLVDDAGNWTERKEV